MIDARAFGNAVIGWYERSGRHLEMRSATSPWAILVAEVMSQQTQIGRVGPYWRRFLGRWPTPSAFAAAPTRDILEAWAGLGYNRRPLALRDAARRIVSEHGGEVPSDVAALEALPGIGRYTARAVAANAFGSPVAPVDVNVRRVVSRVAGVGGAAVQAEADRLIAAADPARWVHATMDLAATVCTRRRPRCDACPVAELCLSRGTTGDGSATPDKKRPPFESTSRWLRGTVLARLREAPADGWVVFDGPIGAHDVAAVRAALDDLAAEGFIDLGDDQVGGTEGARLRP
ncbi:MAG: A/G-specific adenine glycosylase [Candidatus Limnocylindrales bacterium]